MEDILTPKTVFIIETALVTKFAQHFKIIFTSNDGKMLLYLKDTCETFRVSAKGAQAILLQKIDMRFMYQV